MSSCNINVGSCSARVVDDVIRIGTTLEVTDGPAGSCDGACARVTATCDLTAPAGDYLFELGGGNSTTAALPPAGALALFGEGACDR